MAFKEFSEEFEKLEVCHLGPDTLSPEDEGDASEEERKWEGTVCDGSWKKRVNAGGCRNFAGESRSGREFKMNRQNATCDRL